MNQPVQRKRLDEILIEKGLVTEAALRQALSAQKAHGGRIGSHLLRQGHLDERGLVEALSIQMGCPGVVLSSLRIPGDVVKMVPEQFALARRVVPFAYDPDTGTLRVACENPADPALPSELAFIAGSRRIELHVAAQTALDNAISKYYLGRDLSPAEAGVPTVVLISDDGQPSELLVSLLRTENYRVVVSDSTDDVTDLIRDQKVRGVLVKNSISGNKTDLVERVRRISPSTPVRYYEDVASLILDDALVTEIELFAGNLDLLTSLLASKAQLPVNHGVRVARYVDKICRKLRLPSRDRLIITDAAYLHDIAASYYGPGKTGDSGETVRITARLLESSGFSPTILGILRGMYADLGGNHTLRLSLQALGANILTAVDVSCRTVSGSDRLPLDKFDTVQNILQSMTGTKILPDVADALLSVLRERILESPSPQAAPQIMLYSEDETVQQRLEQRLNSEGFRIISVSSTASAIELYQRSEPDIVILAITRSPAGVLAAVEDLTKGGIDPARTSVLLVTDVQSLPRLTGLLDRGVQDVVLLDETLDLLVSKILNRAPRSRAVPLAQGAAPALVTQGCLADMSLLDLLQVLGPGRKTVKITVQGIAPQPGTLTIYLKQGKVTFARTEDHAGAEAVHDALCWTSGTWKLEPVRIEDIPAANNDLPNESIVMSWCRLQDESVEVGAET